MSKNKSRKRILYTLVTGAVLFIVGAIVNLFVLFNTYSLVGDSLDGDDSATEAIEQNILIVNIGQVITYLGLGLIILAVVLLVLKQMKK